jgi:hypothetical protein
MEGTLLKVEGECSLHHVNVQRSSYNGFNELALLCLEALLCTQSK